MSQKRISLLFKQRVVATSYLQRRLFLRRSPLCRGRGSWRGLCWCPRRRGYERRVRVWLLGLEGASLHVTTSVPIRTLQLVSVNDEVKLPVRGIIVAGVVVEKGGIEVLELLVKLREVEGAFEGFGELLEATVYIFEVGVGGASASLCGFCGCC